MPPSKAPCDDFARHFREKIAQIRHELDSTNESEVSGETPMLPSGPKLLEEFQLLRPDDVGKVLGRVRPTTCLLDPCPSWLINNSKHRIGTWILEVVNASLREGRVPAPLKEVVIRPVLKKVSLDPEMATNYRPVANIPFLGKVLERVVAGQLQALLDETDYLDPFQSGFRPGYGEAVAVLNRCLAEVMEWMRANKLKLNPDKTEVLLVGGSGFGEGGFDLVLNGATLPLRDKVRSLGVLLDPELSLEAQVTAVARSAFLQLRLIHQLHPYLEYDCLAKVTHALVTSRLDFCNALYMGLPLKTVQTLQLVQNRAARLLTGTGRYAHMTPVLRQLHWLPIEARAQFKVLVMTYKALNSLGPGYLNERLRPYMPDRPLRSAGESLLREPSMKEIRREFKVSAWAFQERFPPSTDQSKACLASAECLPGTISLGRAEEAERAGKFMSQVYESSSKMEQFVTRFLLRETMNQLQSLQVSLECAADTIDEQTGRERKDLKNSEALLGSRSIKRCGRRVQKNICLSPTDPYSGMLTTGICVETDSRWTSEINQLQHLIGKLEDKSPRLEPLKENVVCKGSSHILVAQRQISVAESGLEVFRQTLQSYTETTAGQGSCLHVSAHRLTSDSCFILYEFWQDVASWRSHLQSDYSKMFQCAITDLLDSPELLTTMLFPASWWIMNNN
ncbi:N-terminal EF-hand calcium-binding protein 3 [Varanus komodoensis]|nr:N-terminal EF-hand calcium-binding protein 3 [Varanus komodoensis]